MRDSFQRLDKRLPWQAINLDLNPKIILPFVVEA